MTMMIEPPVTNARTAQAPVLVPDLPALDAPAIDAPKADKPRARWPWLAVGIACVLVLVGAWWLLNSTVPVADYDEVVAELEVAEESLATSEAQQTAAEQALTTSEAQLSAAEQALATADEAVAQLESDGEALAADNAEMATEAAAMQAAAAEALVAVEAIAAEELNWDPSYLAELEAAGADIVLRDNLQAELAAGGLDTGDTWRTADLAIASTNDAILMDAWDRWSFSEMGSIEEEVAWVEFRWRLAYLALEPLQTQAAP